MKKKDKAGKKPKQVARPPFKKPRVKKQVEPKIPDLKQPENAATIETEQSKTVITDLLDGVDIKTINAEVEAKLLHWLDIAAAEIKKVAEYRRQHKMDQEQMNWMFGATPMTKEEAARIHDQALKSMNFKKGKKPSEVHSTEKQAPVVPDTSWWEKFVEWVKSR